MLPKSSTKTDKLALLGPVLPFRGGIAQHTTLLSRALREQTSLFVVSFLRQYPQWLFPGESDRDPAYLGHREPGVEYLIDSLNPLTWQKASKAIVASGARRVLMPWWTVYWAPCYYYLARDLRRAGLEVTSLCHNVLDHEAAPHKRLLTRQVLSLSSQFVVHNQAEAERLAELIPNARVSVHAHPVYDQYPAPRGTLPRRANLELLFFGFVRPYKGLDVLLEALGALKRTDYRLSIVGEFWQGLKDTQDSIRRLGLGDRIELVPRFATEQETAEYFSRADLVVLPYRSATGSGVIPLSYYYGKPVLASRVGGLPEAVRHEETGFLVPSEDPHALAAVLEGVSPAQLAELKPHIARFKKDLTWESLARHVLSNPEP